MVYFAQTLGRLIVIDTASEFGDRYKQAVEGAGKFEIFPPSVYFLEEKKRISFPHQTLN